MVDVIRAVLKLNPHNLLPGVQLLACGVWVLLLVAVLWSIASQPFTREAKLFWAAIIIFLPMVGLTIYCLYCLPKADWGAFEGFKATITSPKLKHAANRPQPVPNRHRGAVGKAT